PFRARDEAVDRLHVGLYWVLVIERRAVAAAFDEMNARHHRIACKGFKIEDERLLDQAMNHQAVLVRVDIGEAGARDDKMQTVRRNRAVEQMVRRARVARARLVVGIGERAYDLVLVLGRNAVGWDSFSRAHAPRIHPQRLSRGAGERAAGPRGCRAREKDAAANERTAVDDTVGGNVRLARRQPILLARHGFLLRGVGDRLNTFRRSNSKMSAYQNSICPSIGLLQALQPGGLLR